MSANPSLPSPPSTSTVRRSAISPAGENGRDHHAHTIDEGVVEVFRNVQQGVSHRYHELEDKVRNAPTNALVSAFAAGYLVKMLPVESIIAAQVRLALSLIRPALFVYGTAKAYEYLIRQRGTK